MARKDEDYQKEIVVHFTLPSPFWIHEMTCKECGVKWVVDFEKGKGPEGKEHAKDCKIALAVANVGPSIA